MVLYLGSAFVLFAIIAYLFYQIELRFYIDTTKHQMEQKASKLSAHIIHAHMMNSPYSLEAATHSGELRIAFYTIDRQPLVSQEIKFPEWDRHFNMDQHRAVLIDQSTFGHLGVEYIVIEKEGIGQYRDQLLRKVLGILWIIYMALAIVGYFLAKLFIKPIQMKRISLDNFIKDSTHELNTPITALMLSLNAPQLTSEKNIERIRLSAKRISDIYQDLIYLVFQETPKSKDIETLQLNKVFHQELNYLTLLAEKRKVMLEVVEKASIAFPIDQESFIRLVHNLITNAIKYNRVGGNITIHFESNRLTIQDTGVGIPKAHLQEIYQRFFRANTQTGGFGLGLNIVDKICKTYGIGIELASKEGEGTIFILKFS